MLKIGVICLVCRTKYDEGTLRFMLEHRKTCTKMQRELVQKNENNGDSLGEANCQIIITTIQDEDDQDQIALNKSQFDKIRIEVFLHQKKVEVNYFASCQFCYALIGIDEVKLLQHR